MLQFSGLCVVCPQRLHQAIVPPLVLLQLVLLALLPTTRPPQLCLLPIETLVPSLVLPQSALRTHLPTATLSVARPSAAKKGKGRASPGDGPPTPPLHMHQRIDPWAVEEFVILSDEEGNGPSVNMRASSSARSALPNASSSSRLGMHLQISDHDHGDNSHHDSVEESGSATVIRDSSGEAVASMRVSIVFESFFYITLAMFATLYGRKFSCRLIPEGADPQVFHEALGALEGFKLHSIPVKSTGSDQAVSLTVLLRNGPEFKRKRLDLKRRLGLTKKLISPIPVSLMRYSVTLLGCMPLENTVTDWVHDLCRFTLKGGNINKTLNIVRDCHKAYANECYANGNTDADLDPEGMVAKKMLKDDVCSSWLLLGIRKPEFRALLKHLTFMIKDDNDKDIKEHIKNMSNSLFKRS
ncbi:hypothetical protein GGI17_005992 [Coemansia sp. S146]|nr:hypothetical protein GGI17_005992 [Coemansia sp. S146]